MYLCSLALNSTKIWQASRATSAATSFFDPIAIGPFNEEFVDGALGANNPVNMLWGQAQAVWGNQLRGKLKCLVSIGTGMPTLQPVRDDVLGIWATLKELATETERIAEQFRRDKSSLDDEGRYYRFNVDYGLQDIGLEESKKKEIAVATGRYIASQAVFKQMACTNNLAGLIVQTPDNNPEQTRSLPVSLSTPCFLGQSIVDALLQSKNSLRKTLSNFDVNDKSWISYATTNIRRQGRLHEHRRNIAPSWCQPEHSG